MIAAMAEPSSSTLQRPMEPAFDEADIDYSDIPPLKDDFWANAVSNPLYKPTKQIATVRIDSDVLLWLKSQGKGYQTRMNAILRQAMLTELTELAETH